MKRYWLMVNGQLDGPYEAGSLMKQEGFSRDLYIYCEGDKFWRRAREIDELRREATPCATLPNEKSVPATTLCSGDMMSPDFQFLPVKRRQKTEHAIWITTAKEPRDGGGTKQSSNRHRNSAAGLSQSVTYDGAMAPAPRTKVKSFRKVIGVVAVFMTAALIVRGSPMESNAIQFWKDQIHSVAQSLPLH